jgi:hypothetical protein
MRGLGYADKPTFALNELAVLAVLGQDTTVSLAGGLFLDR